MFIKILWCPSLHAYADFCTIVNCPALTVGRLVKTSPNNCVTSQMKIGAKCSFSCPQGYQLGGPSYKQCGANGQWTDSSKSVSCKGELNIKGITKKTATTVLVFFHYCKHNSILRRKKKIAFGAKYARIFQGAKLEKACEFRGTGYVQG